MYSPDPRTEELDFQLTQHQILRAIELYCTRLYRGRVSITSHAFSTNEQNAAAFKQVVIRCRGVLDISSIESSYMTQSRSPRYLPTAEDPYADEYEYEEETPEPPTNGNSRARRK